MADMDPTAAAYALASHFNDLSQEVDDYRLNVNPPLSRDQMARLKDEAQALEDRAHSLTADAIADTLARIQPSLQDIQNITADAVQQYGNLQNVGKAISIATLALSLGTAIAAGDPATIIAAADALADGLTGTTPASAPAASSGSSAP